MQFFKRLIQQTLTTYETHELNGRYFPRKLAFTGDMARIILYHEKKLPLNKGYLKRRSHLLESLDIVPMSVTLKKIVIFDNEKKKDFKKRQLSFFVVNKNELILITKKQLESEFKIITTYFKEYGDVTIEKEPPKIMSYIPGVVGVRYPALTYGKQDG